MQHGFKIVETPIVFMDRRVGKSKMSRKIVIEGFTYVFKARFGKQSRQSHLTTLNNAPEQPQKDIPLEELPSVAKK